MCIYYSCDEYYFVIACTFSSSVLIFLVQQGRCEL